MSAGQVDLTPLFMCNLLKRLSICSVKERDAASGGDLLLHLLRQGVSLKAIGDVLGHRTVESTCGYLRLSFQDLRDVALPVPREESQA